MGAKLHTESTSRRHKHHKQSLSEYKKKTPCHVRTHIQQDQPGHFTHKQVQLHNIEGDCILHSEFICAADDVLCRENRCGSLCKYMSVYVVRRRRMNGDSQNLSCRRHHQIYEYIQKVLFRNFRLEIFNRWMMRSILCVIFKHEIGGGLGIIGRLYT